MKIVKNRFIYFGISIVLMLIGAAFAFINANNGNGVLNFDVQFLGGTAIEANIGKEFNDNEIAELIKGITGDSGVQVQKTGDGTSVIIKTKYLSDTISENNEVAEVESEAVSEENEAVSEAESEAVSEEAVAIEPENEAVSEMKANDTKSAIVNALVEKYGIAENSISINEVSATISTDMWKTALLAVLVACITMLIYITVRFRDLKTGASIVLALVHDVLIVLAFYAVVRVPVNSTFIAAILTVLGYSVNASIVIFDRIRENKSKYSKLSREEIIDTSIVQSMTRSVFTSLTTLFTIAALYFFGVQSVKEFALPIIVGIICGTYSSVFLAGSLWYTMTKK